MKCGVCGGIYTLRSRGGFGIPFWLPMDRRQAGVTTSVTVNEPTEVDGPT